MFSTLLFSLIWGTPFQWQLRNLCFVFAKFLANAMCWIFHFFADLTLSLWTSFVELYVGNRTWFLSFLAERRGLQAVLPWNWLRSAWSILNAVAFDAITWAVVPDFGWKKGFDSSLYFIQFCLMWEGGREGGRVSRLLYSMEKPSDSLKLTFFSH